MRPLKLPAFIVSLIIATACQAVKPYQRVYLNDPEMQMDRHVAIEEKVQDIREGASPAGSTHKPGSCGCN